MKKVLFFIVSVFIMAACGSNTENKEKAEDENGYGYEEGVKNYKDGEYGISSSSDYSDDDRTDCDSHSRRYDECSTACDVSHNEHRTDCDDLRHHKRHHTHHDDCYDRHDDRHCR